MEKLLWQNIASISGLGAKTLKKLFLNFKSVEEIFDETTESLSEICQIPKSLSSKIIEAKSVSDKLKKEYDFALKKNYKLITIFDAEYPQLLKDIYNPPPFFYLYGNIDKALKNVAIVGSRKASAYGVTSAKKIAQDLASCKISVVSGMAIGVDSAAHVGAIKGNGQTIAVLGSGFENVYPSQNKKLFHKIAENGAVISEFSLFAKAESYHFPMRNRIIAGLSLGVLVVEASLRSGSLITANLAAEEGRSIFAMPGNVNSQLSKGSHKLLKDGASLVENAQDIIEELGLAKVFVGENHKVEDYLSKLSKDAIKVLESVSAYPMHIDELANQTDISHKNLYEILLELELKGLLKQSYDKKFYRL